MCSRSAEGSAYFWSIDLKEGAQCIGQISLSPKPDASAWALAFWLNPSHWGHGLAIEAVSSVIESAFSSLSILELWAGVAIWNQRSIVAIERLGFHFLKNNASGYLVSGTPEPIREFQLTQQQWQHDGKSRNA
jgi:RimJ/RimL family protein N-acetyltransferase